MKIDPLRGRSLGKNKKTGYFGCGKGQFRIFVKNLI
jgi:hypothetical protein